eukprot:TRINITY_DN36997_c1_g1_i6.p1 TRINITY_DN36997_c1_g1~~TRINITY_DN36997_c1_g1_i6.p1  ORF type:complete len:1867 (-),score=347.70 TRINITY_DN36997_c1_g1_i6:886-6486(-)
MRMWLRKLGLASSLLQLQPALVELHLHVGGQAPQQVACTLERQGQRPTERCELADSEPAEPADRCDRDHKGGRSRQDLPRRQAVPALAGSLKRGRRQDGHRDESEEGITAIDEEEQPGRGPRGHQDPCKGAKGGRGAPPGPEADRVPDPKAGARNPTVQGAPGEGEDCGEGNHTGHDQGSPRLQRSLQEAACAAEQEGGQKQNRQGEDRRGEGDGREWQAEHDQAVRQDHQQRSTAGHAGQQGAPRRGKAAARAERRPSAAGSERDGGDEARVREEASRRKTEGQDGDGGATQEAARDDGGKNARRDGGDGSCAPSGGARRGAMGRRKRGDEASPEEKRHGPRGRGDQPSCEGGKSRRHRCRRRRAAGEHPFGHTRDRDTWVAIDSEWQDSPYAQMMEHAHEVNSMKCNFVVPQGAQRRGEEREFRGPMRLYTQLAALQEVEDATWLGMAELPRDRDFCSTPHAIHAYTDGSADASMQAWGFCILLDYEQREVTENQSNRKHDKMLGFLGGPSHTDVYCAEVNGIAYAMQWYAEYTEAYLDGWRPKFYVHVDNKAALLVPQDQTTKSTTHDDVSVCRRIIDKNSIDVKGMFTKGHNGCPWNSLADAAAKQARLHPTYFVDCSAHIAGYDMGSPWQNSRLGLYEKMQSGDQWPRLNEEITAPNMKMDDNIIAGHHARAETEDIVTQETHVKVKIASANVCSLRRMGRMKILQDIMMKEGIAVAGLQETRCDGPKKTQMEHFIVISGGCNTNPVTHGCDIWVARKFSVNGKLATVSGDNLTMAYSDYRCTIVNMKTKAMAATLLSAHAPHAGHDDLEIQAYWSKLESDIEKHRPPCFPVIIMVDANSQLIENGAGAGALARGHGDLQPADHFLESMGLFAPHTWTEWNSQNTLLDTCFTNTGSSAIDYVLLPGQWKGRPGTAEVRQDVDITISRLDHCMVTVELEVPKETQFIRRNRRDLPYDLAAALADREAVQKIWEDMPSIPWQVHVDTHLYCIQHYLLQKLCELFPRKAGKQRPSWMTESTIRVINQKSEAYRRLIQHRRQGNLCEEAEEAERLKLLAKEVRKKVKDDKEAHMQDNVKMAMYEMDQNNARVAFKVIKQLKPHKPAYRGVIKDSEGNAALTPEEVEDAWLQYWAKLMDGQVTTYEEMMAGQHAVAKVTDVTDIMPTTSELASSIKASKACRQHGGDHITIDILNLHPQAVARTLQPLVLKALATQSWPMSWRGDIHVAIPKARGKFRGIALEDNLGKVVTRHIRQLLIAKLEGEAPYDTYGGLPGRGCDMGVHMKMELQGLYEDKERPYACIFVDLNTAFDKVDREEMRAVRPIDSPVDDIVAAIHSGTWVASSLTDKVVHTTTGVKAGDPVADAAFLSLFLDLVKDIKQRLQQHGLGCELRLKRGTKLKKETEEDERHMQGGEVAYIDDVLIFIDAASNEILLQSIQWVIQMIKEVVARGGFTINTTKGKTEAVLHMKGKNKLTLERRLQDDQHKLSVGDDEIHLAKDYVHLGVPRAEVAMMTKIVRKAINKINEKEKEYLAMLRSPNTRDDVKRRLINIVMSAALYALHVLPRITGSQNKMLDVRYNALVRATFKEKHRPEQEVHIDNKMMRMVHKMPSLATVMRLRRLMYVRRYLTKAPPTLQAAVQHNSWKASSWAASVIEDMTWAKINCDKADDMPWPEEDLKTWENRIVADEGWWRRMMNEINKNDIEGLIPEEEEEDDADAHHRGRIQGLWWCSQCSKPFSTTQGYCLHKMRKHGRYTIAQRMARSDECEWCLKKFGKRIGLVRHLQAGYLRKSAGSCLAQMIIIGHTPMEHEEAAEMMRRDAEVIASNKKVGAPRTATGYTHVRRQGPARAVHFGPVHRDAYEADMD